MPVAALIAAFGVVAAAAVASVACRAIARSMMAGDTVLVEMIGAAIALRTWPHSSAQWKAAAAARRAHRYRGAMITEHGIGPLENDEDARAYLALLEQHPREQDLLAAPLAVAGINPDPPADWKEPAPLATE